MAQQQLQHPSNSDGSPEPVSLLVCALGVDIPQYGADVKGTHKKDISKAPFVLFCRLNPRVLQYVFD